MITHIEIRHWVRCAAMIPVLLGLSNCASTTLASSSNLSMALPSDWSDYKTLPVDLYGMAPNAQPGDIQIVSADSTTQRADGGRRIDVFLNAMLSQQRTDLCKNSKAFQPGTHIGNTAAFTAVLCDGDTAVATTTGRIVTADANALNHDVDTIRHQLYHALYPAPDDQADFPLN